MRRAFIGLLLTALAAPGTVSGWSGDAWASISRATIKANADLMINSTWVPKNSFTNWQYGSTSQPYTKGVTYKGVAYTQTNPQQNWPEFADAVANTAGGSVGYGNDCSGFASMCWRLRGRHTTATFESQLGTYWTSLGETGSSASVALLVGDAINRGNSHIILFLNYDGTGIRSMEQTPDNAQRRAWSYSALAKYRPIRRLQLTDAPTITGDGLAWAVDAGKPLALTINASGASTLRYQWRFNGSNLSGATTSRLNLVAQLTNAGNYLCVVTNTLGGATSKVSAVIVYPPQSTVFLDRFDTNSADKWFVNQSSGDTRVTFNYDYSSMGIPSAPGSEGGTTRGVRMEANMTAGAVAAVSLSPKNQSFSGDHRLRFNFWINANGPLPGGGTGSTEHLTAGLGTAGNRIQWGAAGSVADGVWFALDGEGGASDTSTTSGDFMIYNGSTLQTPASGYYQAGSDNAAKGNAHPYYTAAFPGGLTTPAAQRTSHPQQTGVTAAGSPGFAWHEAVIARRGGSVDWIVDGVRLGTVPAASLAASNIFVGYWDVFASVSDNASVSFGLVDNVRIEVPAVAPRIARMNAQPGGAYQLEVGCAPGRYALDASTNLVHWEEVTTFIGNGSSVRYTDPATNSPGRFYRLRVLP